ncbi:glycosyltransferase [Flagellatimonas centrodinii]|uniref:glycosyltransferase n=1 Tax=Flagellatimonas centrodinii TaxID=2806210 RepID=UPI001FEE0099|nr:glycosyltransferase [Flagellatimonas centrodinii]ULQ45280.1 glycosyltransferase [Flagellatimonas centrodinii]
MRILFLHQNFPGQFKHLAPALKARGDDVRALAIEGAGLKDLPMWRYKVDRANADGIQGWTREFETKMIRAEEAWRALQQIKAEGFEPDLVVLHPGWGEGFCVEDVFPDARQLHFVEWYYHANGADVGFDPEFSAGSREPGRVRSKNAMNLLALQQMDWGYSPTAWQRQQVPVEYRERIDVIHDGVDTRVIAPAPDRKVTFSSGLALGQGDELVTFVNRNLEPARGWHVFARSLKHLLKARPNAHVAIVGGTDVSYGARPENGKNWREVIWREVQGEVDASRVHFLGRIPYSTFIGLLQASSCHVYLTVPFVLSWSMLEAMSVGAVVVGSDTASVTEVIKDGQNGLLTPFLDPQALAERVADVLARQDHYRPLRDAARQTVIDRYDLTTRCLPQQLALVDRVAAMPRRVHA